MTKEELSFVSFPRAFWVALGLGLVLAGCESKNTTPHSSTSTVDPLGMRVPAADTGDATTTARVNVTPAGFQPSRIDVSTGQRLVFRRTTDKTCATSVVFPTLGIERALPLDTDVPIDLPHGSSGELAFQCGMGMACGKVVVR